MDDYVERNVIRIASDDRLTASSVQDLQKGLAATEVLQKKIAAEIAKKSKEENAAKEHAQKLIDFEAAHAIPVDITVRITGTLVPHLKVYDHSIEWEYILNEPEVTVTGTGTKHHEAKQYITERIQTVVTNAVCRQAEILSKPMRDAAIALRKFFGRKEIYPIKTAYYKLLDENK
jgi:hypothetical protein